MLSVNPTLTPAQVKALIKSSALNTGNTDVPSGNPIYLVDMSAAVAAASTSAQPLLGTNMPTTGLEFGVGNFSLGGSQVVQVVATQFSITATTQVSSINLDISGLGQGQFTLWLTNSIGPGAGQSNVLLQSTVAFPNSVGAVPVGIDLLLNPGTYSIVFSSSQTQPAQKWVVATTVLSSPLGSVSGQLLDSDEASVNSTFPPSSVFQVVAPFNGPGVVYPGLGPAFQVIGTVVQ
jgi:hypothetical protein